MAIGKEEQDKLKDLLEYAHGHDEAEAHVADVLKAVSGKSGINNAKAIMCDNVRHATKDAEVHKAEGNRLFAEGKFDDALTAYEKAFNLFFEFEANVIDADAKKLLVAVYSNSAQAYLKLAKSGNGASEAAISMANHALKWEPMHIKTRFRRGCAHACQEDWSLARADFEWILRMEPGNEAAKRELRSVLKQLKDSRASAGDAAPVSWEKAAAAAVKAGQCDDPRSAQSAKIAEARSKADDKESASLLVQKQEEMTSRMRYGALRHFEAKGRGDEWRERKDELQQSADSLAEMTFKQVSDMEAEGRSLEDLMGPKGAAFAHMDEETRRRYFRSDAYLTTLKQTFPEDFAEIVNLASEGLK
mmetsp:Transcript_154200/g.287472  ORF Transcript_154200/g.287472 Transcript_154200/m.287472 type:complete len:360 (+) Transcript_154200:62-1141(+)